MNIITAFRAIRTTRALYRAGYVRPSTKMKTATWAIRALRGLLSRWKRAKTMDRTLRAYLWSTAAAGFAARNTALQPKQIAVLADQVVAEYELREKALDEKEKRH